VLSCRESPGNLQRNRSRAASLSSRLLLITRHVPPQSRTCVAEPSLSSKAVRFRWSLQPIPDGARVSHTTREYSRHQDRLSDEPCVMRRCNLSSYYKRLCTEDRRTFDRWLLANAIFGSIFAVVLIAMAFAGSRSIAPRDAAVASGTQDSAAIGKSQRPLADGRNTGFHTSLPLLH
jgi:hypothetical protein